MRQFKALTTRRFGRALALAIGLAPILTMTAGHAQEKPAPLSVPDDWTHHHVIFSAPRSQADAARLQHERRYWQQWLLHGRPSDPKGNAVGSDLQNYADYLNSFAGTA